MAMMLSQLLAMPVAEDREVRGITDDSRRVKPGDVYFSLAANPAEFVEQALDRGADAIVGLPSVAGAISCRCGPAGEIGRDRLTVFW